jgi:hypothetical protein
MLHDGDAGAIARGARGTWGVRTGFALWFVVGGCGDGAVPTNPSPHGAAARAGPVFSDAGVNRGPTTAAGQIAEVFGQSDSTLYRLDPSTKAVTVVGAFQGCDGAIVDIALDRNSQMYGATDTALYLIDRTNAHCTRLRTGEEYPNSLSFVPAGTLDPARETLVGYVDAAYYRIDTATGIKAQVGALPDGYSSSGDIVSVAGGGTYLTVKGPSCEDCLVEIDPRTGSMRRNFGPLGYADVFGLTFWGGSAFGFTMGGQLFEVRFDANHLTTQLIPIPKGPGELSFWGAGSTTAAPLAPIR